MLKSIDPSTGNELASFVELDPDGLESALARAWAARAGWRDLGFDARCDVLRRAAGLLRTNKSRYASVLVSEVGKPIAEAEAEIEKCAGTAEWMADNAASLLTDQVAESAATESYISFHPLGVVLAVMPWNFPFGQVFRAALPALVAGNVVLLKHASNVPQSALAIEEVFRNAGAPEGVFQTLLVTSDAVSDIISDPRVAGVTLTGSDAAGANVASVAGKALKKAVLELGGSDPFIVLEDADIAYAAAMGCRARNQNNGQSCIAAKRFIVLEAVAEEFERKLAETVGALKVGDPGDRANQVGPLARPDLVDNLERQIDESVAKGAKVLVGGKRVEGPGYFFEPTVLGNVHPGMAVFDEETFGPVAAVVRVSDEEEAIALANNSAYGLGSSIWTRDTDRARKLASRIEAGLVFVNGLVASDPRLPFGGIKRSGFGRELSSFGIREFMNIQTVWVGPVKQS